MVTDQLVQMFKRHKQTRLSKFKLHYELIESDPFAKHPRAWTRQAISKMVSQYTKSTLDKGD